MSSCELANTDVVTGIKRAFVSPIHTVVVGKLWPMWLPVIPSLGLLVTVVELLDPLWVGLLQSLLPIPWPTFETPESGTPRHFPLVSIAFFGNDLRLPPVHHAFWKSYPNLTDVLFLTPPRGGHRYPAGWVERRIQVSHAAVGGTSNTCVYVHHICRRTPGQSVTCNLLPSLPLLPARGLTTIVDSVVGGPSKLAPAPVTAITVIPVTGVHTAFGATCFDSQGLFPAGHTFSTLFLVPSVLTTTKWTVRALTTKELLLSIDFPSSWLRNLTGAVGVAIWNIASRAPLKVLSTSANVLLADRGVRALIFNRRGFDQRMEQQQLVPQVECFDQDNVAHQVEQHVAQQAEQKVEQQSTAVQVPLLVATISKGAQTRNATTAKDDGSGIPIILWDSRVWEVSLSSKGALDTQRQSLIMWLHVAFEVTCGVTGVESAPGIALILSFLPTPASHLQALRSFLFRCWQRHLFREWWQRCCTVKMTPHEKAVGRDCLSRALSSSWWVWDMGSRCFPWRWPEFYRSTIQDGLAVWHTAVHKPWFRPQRLEPDPALCSMVQQKLSVVRTKRYIGPGTINSCISYFHVPKALTDVRMVYDGTASGLNDTLWVPRFTLPSVESHLRAVLPGYFMADIDIAEMFHNFMLHESLRVNCGVDLTPYFPDELTPTSRSLLERWERSAMGLKPSPYSCVQAIMVARDFLLGDRSLASNPFRWDCVKLNLPGSANYDPRLPWIAKYRISDGRVASDLFIYVDDLRVTSSSSNECWLAARQVSSRLGYLGCQDATRKRQGASQTPEPWAGSVIYTDDDNVYVLVSQEKWDKTRGILHRIREELTSSTDQMVDRKQLERDRGFLIYVSRTYKDMTPYLQGFHLTLDSWRSGRDAEGWRVHNSFLSEMAATGKYMLLGADNDNAPVRVKAVSRFVRDLDALLSLTESLTPPLRTVRVSKVLYAFYGFGDASGKGFGSTIETDDGISFRFGQWCTEIQEQSSNYRELRNLVEMLEASLCDGTLSACELFLFTDNWVSERAYYKGYSDSPLLSELVLRLRRITMLSGVALHVTHIAGTRMIEQGSDGLSRGDLQEGVMGGRSMKEFVPLHLNAFERAPRLKDWVQSWASALGPVNYLSPQQWYTGTKDSVSVKVEGCWIWVPPPAAADVAIELMYEHRHKRPTMTHIFLVPRLMTGRFRKQALKQADIYFSIPLKLFIVGLKDARAVANVHVLTHYLQETMVH